MQNTFRSADVYQSEKYTFFYDYCVFSLAKKYKVCYTVKVA